MSAVIVWASAVWWRLHSSSKRSTGKVGCRQTPIVGCQRRQRSGPRPLSRVGPSRPTTPVRRAIYGWITYAPIIYAIVHLTLEEHGELAGIAPALRRGQRQTP